eukprot:623649-Ditylum_brightwellii.AAC.1
MPRHSSSVRSPKCDGCINGTISKHPWCTKSKQDSHRIRPAKAPWDCISVDQLESSTPGLITQLKGIPTVFVDYFSNVTSIHEQSKLT